MATPKLGRVQHRIMEVLWRTGRATARDITAALNATEPIAHSTVQTLLRKLEAKGAAGHGMIDRTFYFHPLIKPESVRKRATRELIDRVYSGSAGSLVSYLLKYERIPRKELDAIRSFIDESDATEKEMK